MQQVDRLPQGRGHGHGAIDACNILRCPVHKRRLVLKRNFDVLSRQFAVNLLLDRADPGRAGANREIEEQAIAALLPG